MGPLMRRRRNAYTSEVRAFDRWRESYVLSSVMRAEAPPVLRKACTAEKDSSLDDDFDGRSR